MSYDVRWKTRVPPTLAAEAEVFSVISSHLTRFCSLEPPDAALFTAVSRLLLLTLRQNRLSGGALLPPGGQQVELRLWRYYLPWNYETYQNWCLFLFLGDMDTCNDYIYIWIPLFIKLWLVIFVHLQIGVKKIECCDFSMLLRQVKAQLRLITCKLKFQALHYLDFYN